VTVHNAAYKRHSEVVPQRGAPTTKKSGKPFGLAMIGGAYFMRRAPG
jgi:hypothetical protein